VSKHTLRNLKIKKVSVVDRPAQEGATIVLAKRKPDDTIPAPLKETPMADTDLTKQLADLKKSHEELAAKALRLEAVNALSATHRAHYDSLDEAGRAAFVVKSDIERASIVKAAGDADPIVFTHVDGTVLRKSQDPTGLIKRSFEEAAAARAATAVEKSLREAVELEKRADAELPNMGGTSKERAALLKAIESGITDADLKAKVLGLLKGADASMAMLAKRAGHGGGGTPEPDSDRAKFLAIVAKRAADDKVTEAVALNKCLADDPTARDLYDRIHTGQSN